VFARNARLQFRHASVIPTRVRNSPYGCTYGLPVGFSVRRRRRLHFVIWRQRLPNKIISVNFTSNPSRISVDRTQRVRPISRLDASGVYRFPVAVRGSLLSSMDGHGNPSPTRHCGRPAFRLDLYIYIYIYFFVTYRRTKMYIVQSIMIFE